MKVKLPKIVASAVAAAILVSSCTSNTPAPTTAPTQRPATQAPATQAPATQAPASQAPATQAPASQAPAATEAVWNDVVSPPGVLPIVDKRLVITAFADVGVTADVANHEALKRLEKETNIWIDVVGRPSNSTDAKTQRNLMLASNSYPDVFITGDSSSFNQAEIVQYGMKEGILIPVDDLYEKYGYELKKVFELRPEYYTVNIAPDGHMYGITRMSESYHSTISAKHWVRVDWMEKLNIPQPQTIDDFYDMMVAFKTKDPIGDGTPTIPFTGYSAGTTLEFMDRYVVNSYIPYNTSGHYCYLDANDKIVFTPTTNEYKEALKFMKKCWDNGLCDPSSFTQNRELMQQTIRKEPWVVGSYSASVISNGIINNDPKAAASVTALLPVKGPNGAQWHISNKPINFNLNLYSLITDRCKTPEAAFRLFDYFSNEECATYRTYGVEGVDWKHPDTYTQNMAGGEFKVEQINVTDQAVKDSKPSRVFGGGNGLGLKHVRDTWQKLVSGDDLNKLNVYLESRLQVETEKLEPYVYPKVLPGSMYMSEDKTTEFQEMITNLENHHRKSLAQFVTGDRDIDKDWDAYLAEMKAFGCDKFVQYYQEAYDAYQKLTITRLTKH